MKWKMNEKDLEKKGARTKCESLLLFQEKLNEKTKFHDFEKCN